MCKITQLAIQFNVLTVVQRMRNAESVESAFVVNGSLFVSSFVCYVHRKSSSSIVQLGDKLIVLNTYMVTMALLFCLFHRP